MEQKKKRIIIAGSVLAAVVIVLIGVFLYQKRQPKEQKQVIAQSTPTAEATAAPTDTPAPTPTVNPHAGKVQSAINGKWVSKKQAKKRPYAVMINNIKYAFEHQKGTSKADIIYEALAEGGITRMMAIYQDPSKVKVIGSVRSARHYYVQFANEWNAIYCHFGQTKYATAKINALGTNNLSGLSAIGPVVYSRDSSISAPHNVFTTGAKLKKGAKKLGYALTQKASDRAKHFTFYKKDTKSKKGKKATNIVLPFSSYSTCELKYNKKKKKYFKYEYNEKQMDIYYNKQLSFKNVIIQFVEESNIDKKGYQTMSLSDNAGKGWYISDGKAQKITWKRKEAGNTMVYKTSKGKTLKINAGKTYIAVYPKSRSSLVSMK